MTAPSDDNSPPRLVVKPTAPPMNLALCALLESLYHAWGWGWGATLPGFLIGMALVFLQASPPYDMLSVVYWTAGMGGGVFFLILLICFPFELKTIHHKAKTTEYSFYEDRFLCKMAGEVVCEMAYRDAKDLTFLSKQPKGPSRRGTIRLTVNNPRSTPLAGRIILNVEESVYYQIMALLERTPRA